MAQRPQDPLRDGGHLVVDERWHLDDGVPVVAVREVLRVKEDTFCPSIGERFIIAGSTGLAPRDLPTAHRPK